MFANMLWLFDVALIAAGFLAFALLFARFPQLDRALDIRSRESGDDGRDESRANAPQDAYSVDEHGFGAGGPLEGEKAPTISIIIPMRNEETSIGSLLDDLALQTVKPLEIICVDDASSDASAQIAARYGPLLVRVRAKPKGWLGKSWACQLGSQRAHGELLLFLDADVRLGAQALADLLVTYHTCHCTLSVQPFHRVARPYEQLSFFFNLIEFAANGLGLAHAWRRVGRRVGLRGPRTHAGLCGPLILIHREVYTAVGGHATIRRSVADDLALGRTLWKHGLPFRMFLGTQDISYRMYPSGFRTLVQGWSKNQLAGITQTPPLLLVLVFFWITALATVPVQLFGALLQGTMLWALACAVLYLCWVFALALTARSIGTFSLVDSILYPLLLLFYIGVLLSSLARCLLGTKMIWKERDVGAL